MAQHPKHGEHVKKVEDAVSKAKSGAEKMRAFVHATVDNAIAIATEKHQQQIADLEQVKKDFDAHASAFAQ